MDQWGVLQLVLYAAGTLVALAQGAIFAHYFRVYRREYLQLWSLSFFALGLYLACAGFALGLFATHSGTRLAHIALSALSLLGAYCQVVLLVMGTLAIWRERRWTRMQLAVGLTIASAFGIACALAYASGSQGLAERLFLRVGLRYLIVGTAYLAMGVAIATRWPRHKLGQQLTALVFAVYGLELLHVFALYLVQAMGLATPSWTRYTDVFDVIAQTFIGFGLVVWLLEDERGRAENAAAAITHLRHFDPLTGLSNRERMLEHLGRKIARPDGAMLLLLRLDNLGHVAAAFGTVGVDSAIAAVAERIDEVARSHNLLAARPGADHFALQGAAAGRNADTGRIGTELLTALAQPVAYGGREYALEASVGIAFAPRDAQTAEALLSCAEIARARARQDGAMRFRYYAPELDAQAEERLALHAALRTAFAQGELVLEFQPILDGNSLAVCALEALVRWQHPQRGRLLPEAFIAELEPLGLIEALDKWVLERACAAACAWQREGAPRVPVAVNVSARSFQRSDFPDTLARLLDRFDVEPGCLELEIVESIALEQPERAVASLERLRAFGVRVMLDDFGTGFSSLKHLRQLPIDGIKIDRSFVIDVLVDTRDAAIVRAMLALAHSLGLDVVAEGIESAAQLAWFQSAGCDRLQGFHFHEPLALDAVIDLLHPRRAQAGG